MGLKIPRPQGHVGSTPTPGTSLTATRSKPMTYWLFGVIFFVLNLAAILLLVGTWQNTRIQGFLLLAGSYVVGMLGRWIVPLAYRISVDGSGQGEWVYILVQSTYVVVACLAVWGFWDIYRSLKRPATGGQ